MTGMSLGQIHIPGGVAAVGPGLGVRHSATYFLNLTYSYKKVTLDFFQEVFLYLTEANCCNPPSLGKSNVSLAVSTET